MLFLLFAFENQETQTVNFLKWTSPALPLYIFLYVAFAAGLLFWFVISVFNTFKLKGEIFKLQKENRKIREELDRLRNVNIEEEVNENIPEKPDEDELSDQQI